MAAKDSIWHINARLRKKKENEDIFRMKVEFPFPTAPSDQGGDLVESIS